jgi:hypothetical protein
VTFEAPPNNRGATYRFSLSCGGLFLAALVFAVAEFVFNLNAHEPQLLFTAPSLKIELFTTIRAFLLYLGFARSSFKEPSEKGDRRDCDRRESYAIGEFHLATMRVWATFGPRNRPKWLCG